MFSLFLEGGLWGMTLLTLELIGLLALISGIVYTLLGFSQAMGFVQRAGDISFSLLAGGLRVACIPVIYGMLIYMLSLVIRLVQKPRI